MVPPGRRVLRGKTIQRPDEAAESERTRWQSPPQFDRKKACILPREGFSGRASASQEES